jgi:hypothetical protein
MYRFAKQYEREQVVLNLNDEASVASSALRNDVTVLIDSVDVAVAGAVKYAISLNPRRFEAVHFVLDDLKAEHDLSKWSSTVALKEIPLKLIDCPDRRLSRSVAMYAKRTISDGDTELTLLLPRRIYSKLLGRILHDQTAEQIAAAVGSIPHVVATIIPFDVASVIAGIPSMMRIHIRALFPKLQKLKWRREDLIRL